MLCLLQFLICTELIKGHLEARKIVEMKAFALHDADSSLVPANTHHAGVILSTKPEGAPYNC